MESLSEVKSAIEKLKEIDVKPAELARVVDFAEKAVEVAEKANTLLVNAYSVPSDETGIRFRSEDAVQLQWALRSIGVGDDSGEPCFTV